MEIREDLDKRSSGYKRRKEAVMHKPDAAIQMLDRALKAGFTADYVLMDSWFTHEPLLQEIMSKGLHVIEPMGSRTRFSLYQSTFIKLENE